MKHLSTILLLAASMSAGAQTHVLDVNTKKLGAPVQPTMYGIFFEDINYAADGGLYAELVMNRSFEYPNHFHLSVLTPLAESIMPFCIALSITAYL